MSFSKGWFVFLLCALFCLQQLSLPFINNVQLIGPIFILSALVLCAFGVARVKFDIFLTMSYFFATCSLFYVLLSGDNYLSLPSFLYFIVLYSVFFLVSRREASFLNSVPIVAAFFAVLGILQFASQEVGAVFLDVRSFVPDSVVLLGYNYTYETHYLSGLYKSNGGTFLEPSFFSQFMALSLIIEFHNKRRLPLLLLLVLSILSSYSGTGFVLLVAWAGGLFLRDSKNRARSIAVASLVMIAIFIALSQSEYLYGRFTEISSDQSSAYIRFMAPVMNYFYLVSAGGVGEFLFGYGAGSADRLQLIYLANYTAIFKSLIEYGVVFTIFYFVWWLRYLRERSPQYLEFPLLAFVFLASGSFLQPITLFTVWLFCFFGGKLERE